MTANEGFFELQADDNKDLLHILTTHPAIDSIKKKITSCMYLKTPLEATELNRFCLIKILL
jgi:ABC-2 type transport system ATP-binding protein